MVSLDVLVPTRNRARLLSRALDSLLGAPVPAGLAVNVIVIDNGSEDTTPSVLEWYAARYRGRVHVVLERRCGKSRALNAGIAAGSGELVGMIDDDEEIGENWYAEVLAAFSADPALDFVGGPYIPVWAKQPPDWIPADYLAVLGEVGTGLPRQPFGPSFPGILKGGNAVIRRSALDRVGPYAEYLGPAGSARLLSCEDEEMYLRLVKAGARGMYLPTLRVHHHVCASRLSPVYFRRWCFWRGVSRGLMDRAHPLPVRYLAGVPRFLFGAAAHGLSRIVEGRLRSRTGASLSDELKMWDLAGYLWGRHIYTLARYSPVKSRRSASAAVSQTVDPQELSGTGDHWNRSCYFDVRDGGPGSDDHHQTCRFCMVEHRRASTSPL